MTKTLTTETIKLWRINAEITLGETDELDPENNAAKAILDLTAELLRYREAEENPSCWEIAGQLFTTKEEALKPGYRGTPEPLYDGPVLTDDREAQPAGFYTTVSGRGGVVWHNGAPEDDTAIYTAPPAPAVVKLPTEFYSDEGVVVRLEEVMAALALVGVKYERKGNACRAAMLAQPVSQGCNWIACGEQLPAVGETVLVSSDGYVSVGELERSGANYRYFTSVATGRELTVTHWMPLPAAPGRRQRPETRTAPAVPEEAKLGEMPFLGKSERGYVRGWNDCRAAMLAQPVSQGYKLPDGFKLMPIEMTDEIGEAIALEARCCGGIALCIYEAALAAAPEGGNG